MTYAGMYGRLGNQFFRYTTRVLQVKYYPNFEVAIELIKKNVVNPVFYMFSHDVEWVKNNIHTGYGIYYEDGIDPNAGEIKSDKRK